MGWKKDLTAAVGKVVDLGAARDAKRVITLERLFRCPECGRCEVFSMKATPRHCGRPMDPERELFHGGDPESFRLDIVELRGPKGSHLDREDGFGADYFKVPDSWQPAFTVWVLRPGRMAGERLGWVGQGLIGWEYKMVPGLSVTEGTTLTRDEAIALMWATINDYRPTAPGAA